MPSWLSSLFGVITGPVSAVYRWVTKIISAVYSYIKHVFDQLASDLAGLARSTIALYHSATRFIQSVATYARWIVDVVIHDVTSWTQRIVNDVSQFATDVYNFAAKWIDWLHKYIDQMIHDLTSWVVQHVWQPLYSSLTVAWHWIDHEGAFVWDLITHPDKLVKVLGKYLWQSSLDLIKQYAQPIGRWLINVMPGSAGAFVSVLEKIIESIL